MTILEWEATRSYRRPSKRPVMEYVLVRYAEIGTKSRGVQLEMLTRLRDRIAERLTYESLPGDPELIRGRIRIDTSEPSDVARVAAELPGVASTSPVIGTDHETAAIRRAADRFDVGDTFAIDANTAGDHTFDSQELNRTVGAHIDDTTDATVDLDDPDTRIEIDVRDAGVYVFTTRYPGPGGFPVGSQAPVAALISGGIDSPVAAYQAMTRGSEIRPIYCYNRPYTAGDHLARFETVLDRLQRIHPAGDWSYYLVDMTPVNNAVATIDTGRMLIHRAAMFRTAERIAADNDLAGIVTGEAIGQKSSQTATNLARTTRDVSLPIHRPLLTMTKADISNLARELGTYELSTVDSACRTIAPNNPATALSPERFDELATDVGLDDIVDAAYHTTEHVDFESNNRRQEVE